jgi:hypothetical protein
MPRRHDVEGQGEATDSDVHDEYGDINAEQEGGAEGMEKSGMGKMQVYTDVSAER